MDFDAVMLAGGGGRRLGGVDKAAIIVGGRPLLERALDAVGDAQNIVVVGPRRHVSREVTWATEDPPGGGPVAAIAAGLEYVTARVVVVLGVDHPFVEAATVARLVHAIGGQDGAVIVDPEGSPALVGAYKKVVLRSRLAVLGASGVSMKSLVTGLCLARVEDAQAAIDIDTTEDLQEISPDSRASPLDRDD